MLSMLLKEARDDFDRMLEMAKQGGVVLKEDDVDVAVVLSAEDYAWLHKMRVERLLEASAKLAAEAAANGLTEEKLAELLK